MMTLEQWSAQARRYWAKYDEDAKRCLLSPEPQNESEGWVRFSATIDEIAEMVDSYDYRIHGTDDPRSYYVLCVQGPRNITARGPMCSSPATAELLARLSRGHYTWVKEFDRISDRCVNKWRVAR